MVVLPLIYLAVIAATIYGVQYHATHNLDMLKYGSGGRAKAAVFLAYLAPIVVGADPGFLHAQAALPRPQTLAARAR